MKKYCVLNACTIKHSQGLEEGSTGFLFPGNANVWTECDDDSHRPSIEKKDE
jgi:hypothetical protein